MTIFGTMFIALVILKSCGGNSIESDAKKYAQLMCKAQKLATEVVAKAADRRYDRYDRKHKIND